MNPYVVDLCYYYLHLKMGKLIYKDTRMILSDPILNDRLGTKYKSGLAKKNIFSVFDLKIYVFLSVGLKISTAPIQLVNTLPFIPMQSLLFGMPQWTRTDWKELREINLCSWYFPFNHHLESWCIFRSFLIFVRYSLQTFNCSATLL